MSESDGKEAKPDPADTSTASYDFTPPDATQWIRPGFAVIVVCVVATLILGILVVAVWEIHGSSGNNPATADPNAGTIAALAGAALSAITSLSAAYFGIKVASEQSSQASAQASLATTHALTVLGNSKVGSGE